MRYGFVVEDAAAIDSHLATYNQSGALSGIDDRAIISVIVKAVQELIAEVNNIANTVANFADKFTTKELTFTRAT